MNKKAQTKQNTTILILLVIIIVVVGILVFYVLRNNGTIVGNVVKSVNADANEKKCSPPYILVGGSCCLDNNYNGVCDEDEGSYCGDGVCNTNERAIQCNDCDASLRIENVNYDILEGRQLRFRISNYNVIKLGDSAAVYPSLDIYAGYSDKQCKAKNLLQLYRKDLDCSTNCYYIVDQDKIGKSYLDGLSLASESNDYQNPDCIYFVFGLKPYDNINGERLITYESPLIDLRNYILPPVSTVPVSVY